VPTAVFEDPVVFEVRELIPIATLKPPVVMDRRLSSPNPTLDVMLLLLFPRNPLGVMVMEPLFGLSVKICAFVLKQSKWMKIKIRTCFFISIVSYLYRKNEYLIFSPQNYILTKSKKIKFV
jgi:hypothetical protein